MLDNLNEENHESIYWNFVCDVYNLMLELLGSCWTRILDVIHGK